MIVATAGHIDHGKTLLVKALTGVDTDRLPEEKARGMSIDLGFAYWRQPGGGLVAFVDLPGHERFIRNMLAGATGIDFALLVVAADDGVMPQTVEHLQILDLLGLDRGLIAITKTDRVPAERVAAVRDEVRALIGDSGLSRVEVHEVCALTGAGIEGLRAALSEAARAHSTRFSEGKHFRFAVDRSFTSKGSGTVLTGTIFDGEVRTLDELVVSPSGIDARVRGIQVHGEPVPLAVAGTRCALSVAGAGHKQVRRGDWLLHRAIHFPTDRVDVRVSLLANPGAALESGTQVHLHIATAEVLARVRTQHGSRIAPGQAATMQLLLERPIGAVHGDRFILRDHSARRTLGGGRVLDPFAPDINPGRASRVAMLEALNEEDLVAAISALLRVPHAVLDCERVVRTFNLTAQEAMRVCDVAGAAVLEGRVAVSRASAEALAAENERRVREFHRVHPRRPGMEVAELRAALAAYLSTDVYLSLLRAFATEKFSIHGSIVAAKGHDASSPDDAMWRPVLAALTDGQLLPPTVQELARKLGLDEATLSDVLFRKAKTGEIRRVTEDRFYPRSTLAALANIAAALAQSAPGATFTAAQFRDATGIGRTLAIKVLEFLDGAKVTQRVGDSRRIRKDYAAVFADKAPS